MKGKQVMSNMRNDDYMAMFFEYCKRKPIDMYILNKLPQSVIFSIAFSSSLHIANNNPYCECHVFESEYLLFRFKDEGALCALFEYINTNLNFSFDYSNEDEHIIKGNTFTSIILDDSSKIYIFDKRTKTIITSIDMNEDNYIYDYRSVPQTHGFNRGIRYGL